jgi:hypothetical protein
VIACTLEGQAVTSDAGFTIAVNATRMATCELHLRREKLIIIGTSGLLLVIYHAEPDSPSAHQDHKL